MFALFLVETNSDGDERLREFAVFNSLVELSEVGETMKFSSTEDGWLVSEYTFEELGNCPECGKPVHTTTWHGACSGDCWLYLYGER